MHLKRSAGEPVIADPVVRVWHGMLRVHADLIAALEHALRSGHGLSASEFDVLINIGPREQVRHGQLADRVVLTRTALTRLVDRLVERGWLTRSRPEADQRGVVVTLTEAGRRVRAASARTNAETVRRYFACLTPAELTALGELTGDLRRRNHPPRGESE